MYEDDWVMRQIRQLSQLLARVIRGEAVAERDLDTAIREATGLDLPTIDALPAEALVGLASPGDDRAVQRLLAMAEVLEGLAAAGPDGDVRRAKARVIRATVH